jgi:hypothetical protein
MMILRSQATPSFTPTFSSFQPLRRHADAD